MMKYSYRIFKVFGISVELHITFIFFFLLISLFGLQNAVFWICIFSVVLMHELVHSLVALGFKIDVPKITLTPIGGLASIEVPEDPNKELLISIAGPMSNLALAAIVYAIMVVGSFPIVSYGVVLGALGTGASELLTSQYLLSAVLWVNLVLASFNIVPGFPMDGGRVFRAVVALWTDYITATQIAVIVGQAISGIMIIYGLFYNFWFVIIGIFLYYAGGSELKLVKLKHALVGLTLRDIAVRDLASAPENTSLGEFLRTTVRQGQQYYPLAGPDGRLTGVLDIRDIKKVDRKDYETTPLSRLAQKKITFMEAKEKAEISLGRLLKNEFVLVKDGQHLIGYLTPDRVFEAASYERLVK